MPCIVLPKAPVLVLQSKPEVKKMEKKLRAVLFDLDGTLLDSIPLIRRTFEKVFADFGIPWGEGEVMKTVGLPLRQAAEIYAPDQEEQFLKAYTEFYHDHQAEMLELFPGTIETLDVLRRAGLRLGLVTSKRREPAVAGMSMTGLDRYISHVVALEDTGRPKPYPDCLLRGLELLAVKPGQSVYVGDSCYDVLTGKNAGVATTGVTWGIASQEEMCSCQPDFIAGNWSQLLDALDKIGAACGHYPSAGSWLQGGECFSSLKFRSS
jgi:pyrophosphatase PpaX